MTDNRNDRLAGKLYDALRGRHVVSPLIERQPDLTLNDAHATSLGFLARGRKDGERVVIMGEAATNGRARALIEGMNASNEPACR